MIQVIVDVAVVAPFVTASCSGSASQIEVKGDESRAVSLAGEWKGPATAERFASI